MLSVAIMIGIIGIIILFVYLGKELPEEYMPLKLLFWLCIPLLVNVGLYFCFKIADESFGSSAAGVFEGLFVIGLSIMIFIYFYLALFAILRFFKNLKEKKYIERMTKI